MQLVLMSLFPSFPGQEQTTFSLGNKYCDKLCCGKLASVCVHAACAHLTICVCIFFVFILLDVHVDFWKVCVHSLICGVEE